MNYHKLYKIILKGCGWENRFMIIFKSPYGNKYKMSLIATPTEGKHDLYGFLLTDKENNRNHHICLRNRHKGDSGELWNYANVKYCFEEVTIEDIKHLKPHFHKILNDL